MKKLVIALVVLGGTVALTSCKKDYTCTCDLLGIETVVEYNDLNKSDAETAEAACTTGGICTWAQK